MSYTSKPGGAQPGNNPGAPPSNAGANVPIGQHLQQKPINNPINPQLYMQQQHQTVAQTARQLESAMIQANLSPAMFQQYQTQQMQMLIHANVQQQLLQFQQQQQHQQQQGQTGGDQMSRHSAASTNNQLHQQLQQLQQPANGGGAPNANLSQSLMNMFARSVGLANQHAQPSPPTPSQQHPVPQKNTANPPPTDVPSAPIAAPVVPHHPPILNQPTPLSAAVSHHPSTVNLDQKAKAKIALDILLSSQNKIETKAQSPKLDGTTPSTQPTVVDPKPSANMSLNLTSASLKSSPPLPTPPPLVRAAPAPAQSPLKTVPASSPSVRTPTPKDNSTTTAPSTTPPAKSNPSTSLPGDTTQTTPLLKKPVDSPKITSPRTKQTPRKSNNPIKAVTPSKSDEASAGLVQNPPGEVSSSSDLTEPTTGVSVSPNRTTATATETSRSNDGIDSHAAVPQPAPTNVEKSPISTDKSVPPSTPQLDSLKATTSTIQPTVSPTTTPAAATTTTPSKKLAAKPSPVASTPHNSTKEVPAPTTTVPLDTSSKAPAANSPPDASPKLAATIPPTPATVVAPVELPTKKPTPAIVETPKRTAKVQPNRDASSASKRHRAKTILYQSPTPELALVTKLSVVEANAANSAHKNVEDRLVLFYKNEFLAVRNSESSFFLCQTLHNIYKSSPRIRIRWLSELATDPGVYEVDFYDVTDLECVLTSLELERAQKNNYKLAKSERERIENILRRAIDVETGVLPKPDVTAENPDGLDLSLYTSESQIDKKVTKTPASKSPASTPSKRKPSNSDSAEPVSKLRKTNVRRGRPSTKTSTAKKAGRPLKSVTASSNGDAPSEDTDDQDYSPVPKKKKVAASSEKKSTKPGKTAITTSRRSEPTTSKESPLTSRVGSRSTPRRTVVIVRSVIDAIEDEESRRKEVSSDSDSNEPLVPKGTAAEAIAAKKSKAPEPSDARQKTKSPTTKAKSPVTPATARGTRTRH